jgi:hypothetical protein
VTAGQAHLNILDLYHPVTSAKVYDASSNSQTSNESCSKSHTMDWNSEATKKHIAEAKAKGCELIGPGKNAFYRLYRLPCKHEQQIQTSNMRRSNFRCQTCLDKKLREVAKAQGCELLGSDVKAGYRLYRLPCGHEQKVHYSNLLRGSFRCQTCQENKLEEEAKAQGCALLGPGKNAFYRLYRLPCGHEHEIQLTHMREGNFRCQRCLEKKLKDEAEAQGCALLGPGNAAGLRLYRLPCGHEQDIPTHSMRLGKVLCQTCQENKLEEEAKAQDCELIGPGNAVGLRLYRLPCGHEKEIYLVSMRKGSFRCQTCQENKLEEEAKAQGCELLGSDVKAGYRLYRLPCGHEQEIPTHSMRLGKVLCQTCQENKLEEEAKAQGCEILGLVEDSNYRLYRLPCGHEREIQTGDMRLGNFRCQTCQEAKLREEAEAQGCELLGTGKNANFRLYHLSCGHKQQIHTGAMRIGGFRCQTCDDYAYTQPSQVYLLHIKIGADEWLKLGFAKNVDFRTTRYGLPEEAEVSPLTTKQFETGLEAYAFEQSLHKKFKRDHLSKEDMLKFHIQSGATECYPVWLVDKLLAGFRSQGSSQGAKKA